MRPCLISAHFNVVTSRNNLVYIAFRFTLSLCLCTHAYRLESALCLIITCFLLVSSLAYSSTLETESTCSSETSVSFLRTTWRCIPKAMTLKGIILSCVSNHVGFEIPLLVIELILRTVAEGTRVRSSITSCIIYEKFFSELCSYRLSYHW
jgi:hypothetical protein